jgi:pyrroline-5-carboxylate reductase
MALHDKRVVFIGGGMMASAIIRGVLRENLLTPSQISVADPNTQQGEALIRDFGVRYTPDNAAAIQHGADVIVLATKPQFFGAVAKDIGGRLADVQVVLSIMAGVPVAAIAEKLSVQKIVRSMPNTPGAIGKGITAWMATESVAADGLTMTAQLLGALGETLRVPEERYLDMATAVSGSGPAYVFLFMEAMIDTAVHMGFSRADAEKLVLHTVNGSAAYALESGQPITTLRHQVTSPGGTTAEALYHMEKQGLRHAITRGIWAAFQRSILLGGGSPRNPDTSTAPHPEED